MVEVVEVVEVVVVVVERAAAAANPLGARRPLAGKRMHERGLPSQSQQRLQSRAIHSDTPKTPSAQRDACDCFSCTR